MKMSNVERRDRELVYISDDEVFEEQKITRRLTQELNTVDRSDFVSIKCTDCSECGNLYGRAPCSSGYQKHAV